MLGRRKRNRYKFTEKKQSKRGIAALVVAILIEIVYIVFLNAAFRGDGNLSMYYGSAGILMLGKSGKTGAAAAWHLQCDLPAGASGARGLRLCSERECRLRPCIRTSVQRGNPIPESSRGA